MLRTHHCGELTPNNLKQQITLSGWVASLRDHGGVNFIDLRDRWGVTQVVFRPERDAGLHEASKKLRPEFCIQVKGVVEPRPEGTINKDIPTGEIEVLADQLNVLSVSRTPPFEITEGDKVSEELRLKYRYLDLRRQGMQEALAKRSKLIHDMRVFLQSEDFLEIETPVLTKSTPEGARDYLVPSRVSLGQFFALPQSPQLFKQLLMVSGIDRYFQIAKCFRDEDLRADRQPEFTQMDLEMSFVEEKDIFDLIEKLLKSVLKKSLNIDLKTPFERISYKDAIEAYGTDKPDLRFGLRMTDISDIFKNTSLGIFKQTITSGGAIVALRVPEPKKVFSRKDFDDLISYARSLGAPGLAYLKVKADGVESPIAKFMSDKEINNLRNAFDEPAKDGDLIFFAADKKTSAHMLLGQVRLKIAGMLDLVSDNRLHFAWVHEFPLFKLDHDTGSWQSEHHPFTGPHPDDLNKLGNDNASVRSLSYDLVLNGSEIASGSIRIHDAKIQQKIFETLGIDPEHANERFGFLLKAFQYGPPPHGGLAIGLDRLLAIALKKDTIRELIAFPKTQKAICPLTDAPSCVDGEQLKELGIKIL